jgi:hypothetical protein
LVQKQLANQNEAHKQLEAVKKEAEESAKQHAKELLASQQKVEKLTAEMANQLNVEHHSDSTKQAKVLFEFLGILLKVLLNNRNFPNVSSNWSRRSKKFMQSWAKS